MNENVICEQWKQLLKESASEWSLLEMTWSRIFQFYRGLVLENQKQNLTTLIDPVSFFEGHLQDVLECLAWGQVSFPALDLGSGAGVPGLLAALIQESEGIQHESPDYLWVLTESEKRKADYLQKMVDRLNLNARVFVYPGRAEHYLATASIQTIVVRAVGSLEKILRILNPCSTWNNLVLMKGPRWEQEVQEFQIGGFQERYRVISTYHYEVGSSEQKKQRCFIHLKRLHYGSVPRGTFRRRKKS